MTLDEVIYISSLYNVYGELLTEKQQNIFTSYIFDNLSLGEIADIYYISRQAVLDSVNKSCQLLNKYESILKVVSNNNHIKETLTSIKSSITEEEVLDKINQLLDNL